MRREGQTDDDAQEEQSVCHALDLSLFSVPQTARVHDGGARVLDVGEPRSLRDCACLGGDDAELQPERPRADRDRLASMRYAVLRPPEHVDEIDLPVLIRASFANST